MVVRNAEAFDLGEGKPKARLQALDIGRIRAGDGFSTRLHGQSVAAGAVGFSDS